jgi:hypothetical protein
MKKICQVLFAIIPLAPFALSAQTKFEAHNRLWTLDEIKAGVEDCENNVKITYPKGGFSLSTITGFLPERNNSRN